MNDNYAEVGLTFYIPMANRLLEATVEELEVGKKNRAVQTNRQMLILQMDKIAEVLLKVTAFPVHVNLGMVMREDTNQLLVSRGYKVEMVNWGKYTLNIE
jgi:hypothetical protein